MEIHFRKITLVGWFLWKNIGIIKSCIKKVVGKALLNYDELTTLLAEIEQTLNSRPMTYLSDEHNDESITSSHLLYGWNISKWDIMHIDYREHTKTHSNSTRQSSLLLIISIIVFMKNIF